jgi:vacuolar-type H+-ATPase subunit D/Vma8
MTAVEYLIKEFSNVLGKIQTETLKDSVFLIDAIEKAKEMEKQQIIEAHFQGVKETVLNLSEHIIIPKTLNTIQEIENGIGKHEEGEDYYNKKFKNK